MIVEIWNGLDRRRRAALAAGAGLIVVGAVAMAMWLLRPDYDTLFTNLSASDASAMSAELDRMKVPYRIAADGTSILVDRSIVPATRLKLMGKEMPLHGAVGFELFNNSDFGMTEFAQKINYQRALQGELTRTILSLGEIESARVHLAFPEEGLFKREQSKAKAAVTLGMRRGESLRPEQVAGIQRLVAASVNGIAPSDVTIVNQQGVALTRVSSGDAASDVSSQLDLKNEIEQALERKVTRVLARSFGEGNALASVDVTLDMNQVRTTTEDVRGEPVKAGDTPTGVIVRERESTRDESGTVSVRDSTAAGLSFRETDYQVGRRVEQVVTQPGSIQKLHVVAVIKQSLDAAQLAQTKSLVGAAAGALMERGDSVIVQAIGSVAPMSATPSAAVDEVFESQVAPPRFAQQRALPSPASTPIVPVLAVATLVAAILVTIVVWQRSASRPGRALTPSEREAVLSKIRRWLNQGAQVHGPVPGEDA